MAKRLDDFDVITGPSAPPAQLEQPINRIEPNSTQDNSASMPPANNPEKSPYFVP